MESQTQLDLIMAELAQLKAENEALKNPKRKIPSLSFKVSAKGGVSVYGLGRFPVTLYAGQWAKLLNIGGEITAFIEANKPALAVDKATAIVSVIKAA
jgi:hypothetical protein